MQDAAPRGHPLHVARSHGPAVAQAVPVLHAAAQHVGDRLDTAVRMPWKSREIVLGVLVAEIIEQKKWIKVAGVAKAKGPAQLDAGALEGGQRLGNRFYGADGHGASGVRIQESGIGSQKHPHNQNVIRFPKRLADSRFLTSCSGLEPQPVIHLHQEDVLRRTLE